MVPNDEVIVEVNRVVITGKDMRTLMPFKWLCSEIINSYLKLISTRADKNDAMPKIHSMDSFFYTKLSGDSGYSGVCKWTRKYDLFDFDMVFYPIHVNGNH